MKNWIVVFLLAVVYGHLANAITVHYACSNATSSMTLTLVLQPNGSLDQEKSALKVKGLTKSNIEDTKFKITSTSDSHSLVGHIDDDSTYVAIFWFVHSKQGRYEAQFSSFAVDGTKSFEEDFHCEITPS